MFFDLKNSTPENIANINTCIYLPKIHTKHYPYKAKSGKNYDVCQ